MVERYLEPPTFGIISGTSENKEAKGNEPRFYYYVCGTWHPENKLKKAAHGV